MAGTSKNRIRGTVTANLGLLTPTQAFLGADLDDCIGAKPEAADLQHELPLSARKRSSM
jgi:hypothetical protein